MQILFESLNCIFDYNLQSQMKSLLKLLAICIAILAILFFMGDAPDFEEVTNDLPDFKIPIGELESYIEQKDNKVLDLKPGNESTIVWADENEKSKTEYVVLYLHGFSASHEEGNPLHTDIAKRYGYNLYLPRLHDHGRSSIESFINLTPKDYMDSAIDALNVAKQLGNKVILMGCSTGATLGAYLAAHHKDDIAALLFYSPNIDLEDPNSRFITWPWGLKLLRKMTGGNYHNVNYNNEGKKYWNEKYRLEGIIALKALINQTMTLPTFQKIEQPLFMASYYKNDEERDKVVSYTAMQNFFSNVATKPNQKEWIKYPDANNHVFISHLNSFDVQRVVDDTAAFLEAQLQLQPVQLPVSGIGAF